MLNIKSAQLGVIALWLVVIVVVFTGIAYADRNVPAMPEIQGISSNTGMNVQGTITETDSGAWSVNGNGIPISMDDPSLANYPGWAQTSYGSYTGFHNAVDATYHPYVFYISAGLPVPHLIDVLNDEVVLGGLTPGQEMDLINWIQNQGRPADSAAE